MGRPRTSFEMACEDSKNQHTSQSRIFGDHFEASCFIKCLGSSRKNLRSGSVLIKFYFVQEKPARISPERVNKMEEKRGDSKSSEDDVHLDMEITPHSASRYHTTEETLGDAKSLNLNFEAKSEKIGAGIRK